MLEIFAITFLLWIFSKMFASKKMIIICFDLEFLFRKHEHELGYHVAKKKIPSIDANGIHISKPSQINGVKLEKFVFDVFPFSK